MACPRPYRGIGPVPGAVLHLALQGLGPIPGHHCPWPYRVRWGWVLTWEADFLGLKPSLLGERVGETVLPDEAEPFPLSVNQEKGMNGDTDERLEPSTSSLGNEPAGGLAPSLPSAHHGGHAPRSI